MSATFSWSAPIRSPKNATVVVREALLPVLLWPSVPVVREVEERLTIIDRFVMESAELVAAVTAADITEVTGMPPDAVDRIAGRLVTLGLLVPDGPGYTTTDAAAETLALDRPAVKKPQETRLTFLYLPQGDDLIAYQEGPRRTEPPALHRTDPTGPFPLPPDIAGQSRAGYLRERIAAGRVVGLPEGIIDVVDDEQVMPLGCPVYRCTGAVVGIGAATELRLRTIGGKKRQQVNCTIAGAAGQGGYWSAQAGWVEAAVAGWTATGGTVQPVRMEPARWALTMDGPAATAAAGAGIDLSQPAGLSMRSEVCVTYVDVSFHPADRAARRVLALQDALLRITSQVADNLDEDTVSDAASAARAAYDLDEVDLTDDDVRDRLWLERHYLHVYGLRRDFAGYG